MVGASFRYQYQGIASLLLHASIPFVFVISCRVVVVVVVVVGVVM